MQKSGKFEFIFKSIDIRDKDREVVAVAKVSECDYELVSKYKWHLRFPSANSKKSYAQTTTYINGLKKNIQMHVMIMQNSTSLVIVVLSFFCKSKIYIFFINLRHFSIKFDIYE